MNLANKLTLFRVCLIPVFIVILMFPIIGYPMNFYIADIVFIIASATDFLDGYIARSRNMVTNFGKFMDPMADKLLVATALICMVQLGLLTAVVVVILIGRDLIVTGVRLLAVENGTVIAANIYGKIKTVCQMLMIIFILFGFTGLVGKEFILLSVVFSILSGVIYIKDNIGVLKEVN